MPNKGVRVAVITGGTTGIGGASARELAARGYCLALAGLEDSDDLAGQLRSTGTETEFIRVNLVAAQSAAKKIIEETISHYGRLDLLVNCAGTISSTIL